MKAGNLISRFGASVLAKMMLRTVAVLALSILLVEYVAYKKSSEQIINLTEQRQLSLTALSAERFDRAMQRITNDVQTIRDLPSLEEYFLNRRYTLLTEADQQLIKVSAFFERVWRSDPAYARLEVVDLSGAVVLAVVAGEAEITAAEPLPMDLTIEVVSGSPAVVDEGLSPLPSGEGRALTFSRSLDWGGLHSGELRVFYRLDSLTSPLARERLAESGHLAVIAADGSVIFSPEESAWLSDADLAVSISRLDPGTHEIRTEEDQRLLVSISELDSKDWGIAALVPRGELLAGLDTTLRLVGILIVVNLFIEFVFIFLFARRLILRPINRLLAGTRAVLAGDYRHRVDVASRDEFGELATSFNSMTASLDTTLEALRGREQELSVAEELLSQKVEELESEVSERERTAAALSDQSELLRALHAAIPAPIFYKDADGTYLGCNTAFAEMLGLSEAEIVGRTVFDIVPEEAASLTAGFDRRLLEKGVSLSHEATVPAPDEGLRYFVVHKSVFRRGEDLRGVVGVMLEITQRKALEAQLLQSQKMEAVGVLASGVAHDFNNALQVITGFTRLLLDRLDPNDASAQALLQIEGAAERAEELVRHLLTFSRKELPELQQIDLNATIEDAWGLLTRTLPKMIHVELDLDPNVGTIEANPSQLEQVLVNLATNSRDAMPNGGALRFETSVTLLDETFCETRPDLEPGRYVKLRVSDTGVGMDAETRSHIFEPFFSTKEVGKGTGLGLSSVYGITRSHGGHIECASRPGKGALFDIYLPLKRARPAEADSAAALDTPSQIPSLRSETLLLVDDDPAVLEFSRMLLADLGWEIATATCGEEALIACEEAASRPDLVLLDLGMPGMGGASVSEPAARARSGPQSDHRHRLRHSR